MTHVRVFTAALALILAGCGSDPPAPAATTPTGPVTQGIGSPTPNPDSNRLTCHLFSEVEAVSTTAFLDPTRSGPVAVLALEAPDRDLRGAGIALDAVLKANADVDQRSDTPDADMSRAWRYVAEACIALFGDGPW